MIVTDENFGCPVSYGRIVSVEVEATHRLAVVVVERLDDPVAIWPDVVRVVAVIADGVREAHDIKPAHRHALAVMRRGEKPIDRQFVPLVDRRQFVGIQFRGRRRQAREIE